MKTNIIKYIFIIFAICIIGFAIYKINSQNSQNTEISGENTVHTVQDTESVLKIGISDFDNINPLITENEDIISLSTILYEPLLTLSDTYEIEFALAEEWSKSDSTTYLVKLRENLKWQDGSSVTGEDVKFTIDTIKDGKSVYSDNVANIKSVEIIEGNTIRINLKKEEPFFEYNLIFPIISKSQFDGDDFYKSREAPFSTGMYKVTSATEEEIELEQNENWYNPDNVERKIDRVELYFYDTMGDAYNS